MYSDVDIRAAIAAGDLIVKPYSESFLRASGLTLHLGEMLLRPLPGKVVDVHHGTLPEYEEIMISMDRPHQIRPGEFLLGSTYQSITVGPKLGFLIEGRSTLARVGLTVVQTAMMVYPGHADRAVTLELANHGPNPILLYPRMKIARVAIVELKSPASIRYDEKGKYRGQKKVGPPVFEDEILEG